MNEFFWKFLGTPGKKKKDQKMESSNKDQIAALHLKLVDYQPGASIHETIAFIDTTCHLLKLQSSEISDSAKIILLFDKIESQSIKRQISLYLLTHDANWESIKILVSTIGENMRQGHQKSLRRNKRQEKNPSAVTGAPAPPPPAAHAGGGCTVLEDMVSKMNTLTTLCPSSPQKKRILFRCRNVPESHHSRLFTRPEEVIHIKGFAHSLDLRDGVSPSVHALFERYNTFVWDGDSLAHNSFTRILVDHLLSRDEVYIQQKRLFAVKIHKSVSEFKSSWHDTLVELCESTGRISWRKSSIQQLQATNESFIECEILFTAVSCRSFEELGGIALQFTKATDIFSYGGGQCVLNEFISTIHQDVNWFVFPASRKNKGRIENCLVSQDILRNYEHSKARLHILEN